VCSRTSTTPGGDVVVSDIEPRDSSRPVKDFARTRVLVVDDEPLVCWSVAETLAESGYQVVVADDAASAIRAFSPPAGRPDVVLLDLCLPDSTDLRLLSTVRRLSPATPVVVITAHGSPALRGEARRLGAVALVDKPVDMSDLVPLVERALAERPR
jgi:DNA-binding NtrC family response regulator